ncbi:hypothetical protein QR680_005928 [Steinernema hermaphroditum]|uniref:Uncharacterized protein n=1 Tax=Steinernema hermaphroditum TaxID=289476 RepID=A0AA39LW98_9BILA|nr:hypothetical protein QR680_005928 [Steinernema hermaphroditum]
MGSYNEESMPNCSRALEEFGVGSGLSQGDSRRAGSEGVPLVNSEGGVVCADRCLKATEHGAKFRVDEDPSKPSTISRCLYTAQAAPAVPASAKL